MTKDFCKKHKQLRPCTRCESRKRFNRWRRKWRAKDRLPKGFTLALIDRNLKPEQEEEEQCSA